MKFLVKKILVDFIELLFYLFIYLLHHLCIKTGHENSSVRKTRQNRLMLFVKYAISGKKNSTFTNKELHNFNNIGND